MSIKEIALKVASQMPSGFIWSEDCGHESGILIQEAIEFAEALVAELAKENKPILVLFQHDETGRTTSIEPNLADDFERMNKRWYRAGNLYTTPPTAEQIEQETVEACAKVYLNTYDLTDIADDIRSGAWKEYK